MNDSANTPQNHSIPEIYDIDQDTDLNLLSKPDSKPIYSITQIQEVLARVAENGTCLKIECENAGLKYNAIWKRINSSEELRQLDTRARESSLDLRVQTLNELVEAEKEDPQIARLKCDNIKWEAARVYRKLYGEHVTVETKTAPFSEKSIEDLEQMTADYVAMKKKNLSKDE